MCAGERGHTHLCMALIAAGANILLLNVYQRTCYEMPADVDMRGRMENVGTEDMHAARAPAPAMCLYAAPNAWFPLDRSVNVRRVWRGVRYMHTRRRRRVE